VRKGSRRNSDAGVDDFESRRTVATGYPDGYLAASRSIFYGVIDQVKDKLLEMQLISFDANV
jgi:hypothetical protein